MQAALDFAWRDVANTAPTNALLQNQQVGQQQATQHALTLNTSLSILTTSNYILQHSWIADTGSDTHVCNDLSCFSCLEAPMQETVLCFGDSYTSILGYGTVEVHASLPNGQKVYLDLHDVAYVPGLHTNIVSMFKAMDAGIYLNT